MKPNPVSGTVPLSSAEIRSRFLAFFASEKRGRHTIIPSASLVTPDEKGVTNPTLFNTAGMQPLIPYLLGKPYITQEKDGTKHEVTRLADVQKCLRTVDIDDIGDKTHATFFEMLGNWSLGDYFKKEAITWSYEFLTSKSEGLGLDPKRLYVTVFSGDTNAKKDTESAEVWKNVGMPEHRIYFKDAASNWWPAVKSTKEDTWTGPTGPCSEMFYDVTKDGLGDLSPEKFEKADQEQKVVEIWNDVFMEFEKKDGKIVGKLAKRNVDTGAGLERLATILQGVDNIYDTDLLKPVMDKIKESSRNYDERSARIIADHLRASIFLISDGIKPESYDRGYVLRKLLRRAIYCRNKIKLSIPLFKLISPIAEVYKTVYPDVYLDSTSSVIQFEVDAFEVALKKGLKKFEKIVSKAEFSRKTQISGIVNIPVIISGEEAFDLHQTDGLPIELILELAKEKGTSVDVKRLEEKVKNHQSLSRTGAEQKFKGGLADANDPTVVRYHTATHLLHQALHDVLGDGVEQKGSNITAERLRFDFSFSRKMTDEEKKRVEDIVNEKIVEKLPVNNVVMPRAKAEKTGAKHLFNEKYGDEVSIYYIGDDLEHAYSKEFCGGPHVKNTAELAGDDGKARFKIIKEEAISQGVRRIKAVLK